jgi:hypothetical protein
MNSPISAWNALPYFTGISESQKKIIAFVNALGFGSLKTFDQSLWPKNGVLIGDGTADPELARLFVVDIIPCTIAKYNNKTIWSNH